ncbi:MAG TPA: bifunctional proline dehydrogenase/L-glutamate gamma-semialdehyde dehydrogenase PutA [Hellea balneolensis]|uniref:Bifunctional protein PutA n=1 Tax=Hellea balneolensis TaxID=287478 RepID=A0A7C5LVP0_9PROT|nr:bifunctional proline dehydrogenase/L-glutamate gamma-semialdehyde dehydrogenase PutA [Hellea balneolensis]
MNWDDIDRVKFADEDRLAASLVDKIDLEPVDRDKILHDAVSLVVKARKMSKHKGMMESFLEEFGLSNTEGLALMCLAESLLRIPDSKTADRLIAEKISSGDWQSHKDGSESWLVNVSTLGLMLTGKVINVEKRARKDISGYMKSLTRKAGEPVIRAAMMQAMRIMGEQFVVGRTIEDALSRAKTLEPGKKPAMCSFDMLGEGARTAADAERYFQSYWHAIEALSQNQKTDLLPEEKHGISVKLSALHPRYESVKDQRLWRELYPRVKALALEAAKANLNFTLDAEEADRLVISLKILDKLCNEEELGDWSGLGLAVQAYQKRADLVVENLVDLARNCRGGRGRRLMVRLVKGAYWDSEIKHGQVMGFADYPVWTRKSTTDLSYLACTRKLLSAGRYIYAQFATHNANTIAAIETMAKGGHKYEFQRLHGMGDALYAAVYASPERPRPCRVYAPVGAHADLLPYLVRRLLENGANTSFVHSFLDEKVAPEAVAKSPFSNLPPTRHDKIPAPPKLYGAARKNSRGLDLSQKSIRASLEARAQALKPVKAGPIINAKADISGGSNVDNPSNQNEVGSCKSSLDTHIQAAFKSAKSGFSAWDRYGGAARAKILRTAADLMEEQCEDLVALMAKEAGKCFPDGVAEVREAVDFLRYYASEAEKLFGPAETLVGPAGETNTLSMQGRGIFVCISPWNFPLAIFTGQIVAALASGNAVLAKPAEQTPLIAYEAIKILHKAGVPSDVLHFLPGSGASVGAKLVDHPDVAGVCFTGSTEVAQIINRNLAAKDGPIPVLIAETGGLNAMFVDSSALKEQVVDDVIASAFNAAGQRCSALRILFLPEETADEITECLIGAMDELEIDDPALAKTDVGPVIDEQARAGLLAHIERMKTDARILHSCKIDPRLKTGSYVPPTLVEIPSLDIITKEEFGPILHIVRYTHKSLPKLAKALADKGYGLTLGVHSRIESFADEIMTMVPAGNVYVNRNMIGAVVGVQPFGGVGLSGTGPKAGGPGYLPRFATERSISINISAQGGDPALLNLE